MPTIIKSAAAFAIFAGFLAIVAIVSLKRKLCGQPMPYGAEDDE